MYAQLGTTVYLIISNQHFIPSILSSLAAVSQLVLELEQAAALRAEPSTPQKDSLPYSVWLFPKGL